MTKYLGDGIFATHDGFNFSLHTDKIRIEVTPAAMASLFNFIEGVWHVKIQVQENQAEE